MSSSWHLASVAHKGLTTGEQFAQALAADDREESWREGEGGVAEIIQ